MLAFSSIGLGPVARMPPFDRGLLASELPSIPSFFEVAEPQEMKRKTFVFCTRQDDFLEKVALGLNPLVASRPEITSVFLADVFGPMVTEQAIRSAIENQIHELNNHFLHPFAFSTHSSVEALLGPISGIDPSAISGATIDDRMHFFIAGIHSKLSLQRTIFHELLHYGVRRFLSEDEFITQMHGLYKRDLGIKKQADEWVRNDRVGQECLYRSGPAYAIARGVDEALAVLAEDRSSWAHHLQQTQPTQWQRTARNISEWSADLAERLGLTQVAAFLRGFSNKEAIHYIDSLFHKLQIDAIPSSNAFRDHRYAFKALTSKSFASVKAFASTLPPISTLQKASMARIAKDKKPPYVEVIPFTLELPQFRKGDGPLWDPADTPPALIEAAQARFGSIREFVPPQINGGPYQGECYQINNFFLAQEIGPRQLTLHRLSSLESHSRPVAAQLPYGMDGIYLSIDYAGRTAEASPYDPQKTQFIRIAKTIEKTLEAREVSKTNQNRFKAMWRVCLEDVMRARMGWKKASDVVGPQQKPPGVLDPYYQNLYAPGAISTPEPPSSPEAWPAPLLEGASFLRLQTPKTYDFSDPKEKGLAPAAPVARGLRR